MKDPDWQLIAQQLRKPSGEMAKEIGLRMNEANALMFAKTIENLNLIEGQEVLEIGLGNGVHVKDIFEKYPNIHYTGIDYSLEMIESARNNTLNLPKDQINLLHIPIDELKSAESLYDVVFTINTIYFWDDPSYTLASIRSLLNKGGKLHICFRPEHIMKDHPFTKFGFELYNLEKAVSTLEQSNYRITEIQEHKDQGSRAFSNLELPMSFNIITAEKIQ